MHSVMAACLLMLVLCICGCIDVQSANSMRVNATALMKSIHLVINDMYPPGAHEVLSQKTVLLNTNNEKVLRRINQNASSTLASCEKIQLSLQIIKPLTFDEKVKVYQVVDRNTNVPYVWKVFRERESYNREANALATLEHPYVVRAVCSQQYHTGAEVNDGVVIEMIKGTTSIRHFENRFPQASNEEIVQFAARTYDAIKYLHWKGLTHGDLRTNHILCDTDGNPHIIDFEESVFLPNHNRHVANSDMTSPESLFSSLGPRHENIDMWAFGMALTRWHYRKFDMDSWRSDTKAWMFMRLKRKGCLFNQLPAYFSKELRQVLYYCLNPIPQMRRFNTQKQQELFEALPYWHGVDWKSLRAQWDTN